MPLPVDEPFGVGLENRLPAHREGPKPNCELHPARGAGPFVPMNPDGDRSQPAEIGRVVVEGLHFFDGGADLGGVMKARHRQVVRPIKSPYPPFV